MIGLFFICENCSKAETQRATSGNEQLYLALLKKLGDFDYGEAECF